MRKIFSFSAVVAMVAIAFAANAVQVGNIVVKRGVVDTVYRAKHVVVGMADPGAQFTVNGKSVKAYKTGTWGIELQLVPGENNIKIEDNAGSATFKVFYSTTPKPVKRDLAREAAMAEKEEVKMAGVMATDTKYMGYTVKGSLSLHKINSRMINYISDSIKAGKEPRFTLIGKLADPDADGVERIVVKNVSFDDLTLMDWEVGAIGQSEHPFTATAWEVLDSF